MTIAKRLIAVSILPSILPSVLPSFLVSLLTIVATSASAQPSRPGDTRSADVPRTVTLSLSEYNRLVDAASPPNGPPAAPVAAVLAAADLSVRVDGDSAHGTFAIAGDVLRPGVNRVRLVSGATLLDAVAGEIPLPLTVEDGNQTALISGPGPFAVQLEWAGNLTYSPGRAAFTLPVPPAGTARATIDLPGDQADVRLSAGLITRRSSGGGRTVIEATLMPGAATDVSWSMRDSAPVAAAREVRALADVLTLVTLGDADVRLASLVDLVVAQGELTTLDVRLPTGYEVVSVTGTSLERSEPQAGGLRLTFANPALRRHQFLVALERPHGSGSFAVTSGLVSLPGVQRERGEVAFEGVGTLELSATERDPLRRMDVREINATLQSLARLSILAAYRYQTAPGTAPEVAFEVTRFGDAGVLAAIAQRATVTTLVTSEGRALTEVALRIQNRAQPFLKVMLPPGASIVSVDVAGQSAKPASGTDGTRVPLLRPGFRPTGWYQVSFVYVYDGAPFARKGDVTMTLPRMDMPVGLIEWEVFAPDRYGVKTVAGNMIDRTLFAGGPLASSSPAPAAPAVADGVNQGRIMIDGMAINSASPNGIPGLTGGYNADVANAQEVSFTLSGALGESETGGAAVNIQSGRAAQVQQAPSQNVINLQRRASGVLPVRVEVPRAGTSHQFVKPLVIDEEATITLRYKRR